MMPGFIKNNNAHIIVHICTFLCAYVQFFFSIKITIIIPEM